MALPSLVFTLVVLVVSVLASSSSVGRTSRSHPQLLLVSFDGFRYDYLDAYNPPHFRSLAARGVKAVSGMTPAFPTKTFPDHYTIVTGLHPESHGIVGNRMYDPQFNENFTLDINIENKWWNSSGTEPIWITARRQNLTSATYFWPGSEVNFSGVTANRWTSLNMTVPFRERVDTAVSWLRDSIDIVTLYFDEPDGEGHKYGAFSEKVKTMVGVADETLGYLLEQLERNGLKDTINMIVTSDHGMTNVTLDDEHIMYLQEVLDPADYKLIVQTGPVSGILPKENAVDKVFNALNEKRRNFTVYHKKDIPERLHYQSNRRIMPVVLIADEGYGTLLNRSELQNASLGQHGFDNQLPSMRPIFLASGPSFKQNAKIENPFESVNVYPLMCHLLGIEPRPNNGSLAVLKPYLRESSSAASFATASLCTSLILQLLVAVSVKLTCS